MFFKFAVIAFLAVCSMQTLDAKHIDTFRDLNGVIQEIKNIILKLKNKVETVVKNITEDAAGLQNKIQEVINQMDILSIVEDIQKRINDILSGSGIDLGKAKECLDKEKAALTSLAKDFEDGLTACITQADHVMRDLKDLVLDVGERGQKLINDINDKVQECLKHPLQALKCVQDQLPIVDKEVNDFIDSLDVTIASAHELVQKAENDLGQCATDLETKVKTEGDAIVNDFDTCLKSLPPQSRASAIDEIIAKIKEILTKIEEAINNMENQIPQMLEEIKKRVEEILSELDGHKVLDEIKKILDGFLSTVGVDPALAEKCTTLAEESTEKLIKQTEDATKVCLQKLDDETRLLRDNAAKVLDKARAVLEDINNRITVCSNKDVIAAVVCLKDLVEPVVKDVKEMVAEISDFIAEAEKTVAQAKQDLDVCMHGVEKDLVEGEKAVVVEFKNCVLHPTYYHM